MPIVQAFPDGSSAGQRKRLIRTSMDVRNSLGITIDGFEMPDYSEGFVLGGQPALFTGRVETYHSGWVKELEVTITQSDPLPFEVLGIEMEVAA